MTGENKAGESRAEVKAKRDVQFWLDVLMKLTVPLTTGVYTVNCPNGKVAKVAALNGAATISINCQ